MTKRFFSDSTRVGRDKPNASTAWRIPGVLLRELLLVRFHSLCYHFEETPAVCSVPICKKTIPAQSHFMELLLLWETVVAHPIRLREKTDVSPLFLYFEDIAAT
jgi:hypothetical protein